MTAPQRIRLSRAKGFRLHGNAVVVARPSRWGNPFIVGQDGTRLQCATMFAQLVRGFIECGGRLGVDEQLTMHRRIRRHVTELAGKDLACWCPLDGGACHGDVLLVAANPGLPTPAWMKGEIILPRIRLGMTASDIEAAKRKRARRERAAEA